MALVVECQTDLGYFDSLAAPIKAGFKARYRKDGSFGPDDRANAMAVFAEMVGASETDGVRKVLRTVRHASPYMERFVLEAMCALGDVSGALSRMSERYSAMIESPSSTLWENFPADGTPNHAWSGGPLYVLSAYVAGIRPLEPGFRVYLVRPQPGDLRDIRVVVPTVRGRIEMSCEKSREGMRLEIFSPKGTEALVEIPCDSPKEVRVYHDNRLLKTAAGRVAVTDVSKGCVRFRAQPGHWRFEVGRKGSRRK
jgi:hypothetical protein